LPHLCLLVRAQAPGDVVEIQFVPMDSGLPNPDDLFHLFSSGGSGAPPQRGPESQQRLGSIFDAMLNSPAMLPEQGPVRSSRQASQNTMGTDDFRGRHVTMVGPMTIGDVSSMPGADISALFPLPLLQRPGPAELSGPSVADPFADDEFLASILHHMSRKFATDMLPAIHKAAHKDKARADCRADAQKYGCDGARSLLRCLGQHADEISEPCRKDVGKSVPFLCGDAVDKHCNLMEQGVLPCLANHLSELDQSCKDAVVMTHGVIAKVNTQKASLVVPSSGGVEHVHHVHVPMVEPLPRPEAFSSMGAFEEEAQEVEVKFRRIEQEVSDEATGVIALEESSRSMQHLALLVFVVGGGAYAATRMKWFDGDGKSSGQDPSGRELGRVKHKV